MRGLMVNAQWETEVLPRSEWTIHIENNALIVGAHQGNGYRNYTVVPLPNASDDLISLDDLERLIVNVVDAATVRQL